MATKKIAKASKIAAKKRPAAGSAASVVLGKRADALPAAAKKKVAAPPKAGRSAPSAFGASAQLQRGLMALAKRCRESKHQSFAKAEPALTQLAKAYERLLGKS